MSMTADPAVIASLPPSYFEEDVSAPLWHASIAMIVLQTVAVTLFFASRILNKTSNGIDFWLFIPAGYVFCTIHSAFGILLVKLGGAGRHTLFWMREDPGIIVTWLKFCTVIEFTWALSVTFPKLAMLVLYLRIFPTRVYRIAGYAAGVLVILVLVVSTIASFTICMPFAFNWDKTIPGGKCGDQMLSYRIMGFPNLAADIFLLVLPLPAIYKLHVDAATKIGIFLTFISGSFGIVTCMIRIAYFFTIDLFADPTYNCIHTMIWTMVEPGVYLIAVSLPSLRPLKKRVPWVRDISFGSLISRATSWTGKSTNNTSWLEPKMAAKNGVIRTTDIELKSSNFPIEEGGSMHSTARINPPFYSLADIDEQQISHDKPAKFIG
ncbi:unnamed protein product [Periconia digitata]|uniref:Rhodopsin domain-containing protein n=1 Tax=Periconia digitata TaxID=1303443 RepID=A0A9W4UPV5_9PLEO|nr:unnamed protein product [Periconia digitata]